MPPCSGKGWSKIEMANLSQAERARYVQGMFGRIAHRYDLMNRLMTAGQDVRWRREVIRRASLPSQARLLDLGAGTGDLALETIRQIPGASPVAADFTLAMMRVGQARLRAMACRGPAWCGADALNLPFPANQFDAVVSGFLMRNVGNLLQALKEQRRVLKPGGRIVILDTTPLQGRLLSPLIAIHLNFIIPNLGRLLTGHPEAYTYLPHSTRQFLTAEALAERMLECGYLRVGFHRLMFGSVAIHWGVK